MSSEKFTGWVAHEPALDKMKWEEFTPKTWTENDVDIEVTHSGICGSDIHYLRSGWGPSDYPIVVGHEIVGKAVKVGSKVERNIKVGDTVGVGAQSDSCRRADCEDCQNHEENHCARMIQTFGSRYPNGDKSMGGYALKSRVPGNFVFKIPDGLPPAHAAPMMCGGVTVYNPLQANGCGPGKKVGIVGVGGLGHFGVVFAKALGADEVVGISRKADKKDDVLKMGADRYIATDDDPDWAKNNATSLDLIVCTVSSPKMPFSDYLSLLRTHGRFIQVGAPEDNMPGFSPFSLIFRGLFIGGSPIGSPRVIEQMLDLAAKKGVRGWIQERPMKDANKATVDMDKGLARYRYVLTN